VAELCLKYGVAYAALYRCRQNYGGLKSDPVSLETVWTSMAAVKEARDARQAAEVHDSKQSSGDDTGGCGAPRALERTAEAGAGYGTQAGAAEINIPGTIHGFSGAPTWRAR